MSENNLHIVRLHEIVTVPTQFVLTVYKVDRYESAILFTLQCSRFYADQPND